MDEASSRGRIVVGVDGSEASMYALDWAAVDACRRNLPLYVVHALGLPSVVRGSAPAGLISDWSHVEDAGKELLDSAVRYAQETWPTLRIEHALEPGTPTQVLLRLAEEAFHVVVGSRGRGGFAALLLGSVSSAVAEHAKCPVIVVRPPAPADPARSPGRFADEVVVGVDGSPTSLAAVEFAFEQASFLAVPLVVLYVSWDPLLESSAAVSLLSHEDRVSMNDQEKRAVAESLVGMRDEFPDVPVREVTLNGRPSEELVNASWDARLVVVGSRGLGGFAGLLLGSVSRSVLQHAHCPVAIIRPKASA